MRRPRRNAFTLAQSLPVPITAAVDSTEPVGDPKPERQHGSDANAVWPSSAARHVPLGLPKELEQVR